jgi:hypothetical protein
MEVSFFTAGVTCLAGPRRISVIANWLVDGQKPSLLLANVIGGYLV